MPCSGRKPNASSLLLRTRPVLVLAAAFAVIIAWVLEPDSRYTNIPFAMSSVWSEPCVCSRVWVGPLRVSAITVALPGIFYNHPEDHTMPRKPLIAANWKMYKTPAQAQEFMKNFLPLVTNHERDEIVVCPSFTSISVVIAAVTGSGVAIGAQNMHFADEGAFTGETSPVMLKAIGATHVILGHSERRQYFGERSEEHTSEL